MILTIDIGNTNIVLGGYTEGHFPFVVRMATNPLETEIEYAAKIRDALSLYQIDTTAISGAIISSVVPPLSAIVKEAVKLLCHIDPITVTPGIKTGINLRCEEPRTVGADLICACVAAHFHYGSPSLVVDMGTATKILLMDQTGSFIGASIIPGVNISLKALSGNTAQLPQISLEAPISVIGKNTLTCMQSGVIYGNASMIDGMIDRYCEAFGATLPVIATGGLSRMIIPHCKHTIILDDALVLKGLVILYEKNHKAI